MALRVLVTDGMDAGAMEHLRKDGYEVVEQFYEPDELGAALRLRYTPELQFVADDSIQHGAHILEMLRDPDVVKPPNPANEHIILEDED